MTERGVLKMKACLTIILLITLSGWLALSMASPLKDLEAREAEILAQIKELSQKVKELQPDTPQARELRGKLKELSDELREVRSQKRKVLQDMLREYEKELAELKRTNPDSPRIKELSAKLDEVWAKLREIPKPKQTTPPKGRFELRVFELKEVPVEHAVEMIEPFLSEGSVVVGDPRTNKLFIRTEARLFADVEKILDHIDVPFSTRHDELVMREQLARHRIEQHMKRELGEVRELPPLYVTIRPTDEGPQILYRERPVGLEGLFEQLRKVDYPRERVLIIRVLGEVDEQIPEEFIHKVQNVAREANIGRVKVEVIRPEREEEQALRVTLKATKEGVQLLFHERPITFEALARELRQLDRPKEWKLLVYLKGDVPEEPIGKLEKLAEEIGLGEVKFIPTEKAGVIHPEEREKHVPAEKPEKVK